VRGLLNDADIPLVNTITPTGAVRVSNQVTLTTPVAHGLQIGNIINVLNVNDASFGGTFTILTVPTSTTLTYAQFVTNANSGNGTIALVVQGDWATDTVLLPFVNKAYRKVQARLLQAGSKTSTGEVTFTLPAGATTLDDSTSPQLPIDFLAPRVLRERITGNPFFGPDMTPVDILPDRPQLPYNYVYAQGDNGIFFVGALNDTDVLLRYFKGTLYPLTDLTSSILIRGGLDVVADWAAFLAANSRGQQNASIFSGLFNEDMKELLTMQAHSRQYKVGRRMAYNRRSSGGSWGGQW
jgi:hypothetical protein